MIWKLFNKLFGCHYVQYRDTVKTVVPRVAMTPNGEWRMACGFIRGHYNDFLMPGGKFRSTSGSWLPLTFKAGGESEVMDSNE